MKRYAWILIAVSAFTLGDGLWFLKRVHDGQAALSCPKGQRAFVVGRGTTASGERVIGVMCQEVSKR